MSSGPACTERPHEETHRHVVIDRRCNYSAFSGYRRTPSDYSKIRCMVTGMIWRTKAAYVDDLPDARGDEDVVTIYR